MRPRVLVADACTALRSDVKRKHRDAEVSRAVHECFAAGGSVLMPVDAVGRVLELMVFLDEVRKAPLPAPYNSLEPVYRLCVCCLVCAVYSASRTRVWTRSARPSSQSLSSPPAPNNPVEPRTLVRSFGSAGLAGDDRTLCLQDRSLTQCCTCELPHSHPVAMK